ncbi:YvrJ family protein [Priestia flexa]|uniref:YvrJ family protein n=2 Tax=Priestia flexa TaxID=86664 RepID=A0A1N6RG65_9BACI|nr:YvrJ family protein [Priestia flexa]MBN8433153.1 YvrJ family protein [Priestia flexa]MBY6086049.1 YvrJ family protein [Priestia flexa]QCS54004.1 YvrJ family protein [Priestia flexa]RIV14806.1 YvrJ family protein [Priestia flexa]
MHMVEWLSVINQVGFPVVVSFYLLVRVETNIKQLEETIENLSSDLRKK